MSATTRPFYRLSISFLPVPAAIGSLVIGVTLVAIALFALNLTLIEAVIGAVIGVALHWTLEMIYHLGHAYAAQRTGYPMVGVLVGKMAIVAMSVYPRNEPKLPGRVHIQRALGGPIVSRLVGLVFLVLVLLTGESSSLIAWLLRLGLVISFLMSVGALMPIRFLDGGSILYWMRH